MRVVIVGAGIGGLTAALALHRAGIDVEIRERSAELGAAGVGVNLQPYAVAELAELGLLDRLDATGVRTRELRFLHRLGQEILRRPCGVHAGLPFPQFSVHRGRLQGLLLEAVRERLGADAVRLGNRLVDAAGDDGGVRARFAGTPDPVRADVLVGADGIHSAVRALLVPDEGPPHWNGVAMWRGATAWPAFRGGDSMIVAGGTDAKLVLYPIAPGPDPGTRLTNWVLCLRTGRDGDPPPRRQDWSLRAERDRVVRHLDRFAVPDLDPAALVAATAEIFELPMCDRDPLARWSVGRTTLLGDAAHPMYPMGSQGGGQAILDAVALARHLAGAHDPAEALAAYQQERLPVTAEIVRDNRVGGPEGVIDEVERRAPEGFGHLDDVITGDEIEAILRRSRVGSR